jgi:hypothetical protein
MRVRLMTELVVLVLVVGLLAVLVFVVLRQ